MSETPRTALAVSRFKKFFAGAGKEAVSSFRELTVDILSEAVKKMIWPSP